MKHCQYDRKQNVLEIQMMLRINHLLEGGLLINPDGIYDTATAEAVRDFQRQNGLKITGEVDYATWLRLTKNTRPFWNENAGPLRRILE